MTLVVMITGRLHLVYENGGLVTLEEGYTWCMRMGG